MGGDVGKSLHVVIRGPQDPETGERPQRYTGEVASFERAGQLIRQFRVTRAVIDALPETRKAPSCRPISREENSLPGYANDVPDYYDQIKAPVRVLEETTGGMKVARYVEAEADHFAHAENDCTVASTDPMTRKRAQAY